jgi:hypothetical protein
MANDNEEVQRGLEHIKEDCCARLDKVAYEKHVYCSLHAKEHVGEYFIIDDGDGPAAMYTGSACEECAKTPGYIVVGRTVKAEPIYFSKLSDPEDFKQPTLRKGEKHG